jgi:hypothetical protein
MTFKSLFLCLLVTLAFAAEKPKVKSKPDPYDPDKLPPLEVSCGRPTAQRNSACECMKHRQELADVERKKCDRIKDEKERAKCSVMVNDCPAVNDVDGPSYNDEGYPMPAHCKRSCKLAKCECCKT